MYRNHEFTPIINIPQAVSCLYITRYGSRKLNLINSFNTPKPVIIGFKSPLSFISNSIGINNKIILQTNLLNEIIYKISVKNNLQYNKERDIFYYVNKKNMLSDKNIINSLKMTIPITLPEIKVRPIVINNIENIFNELYIKWYEETKFQSFLNNENLYYNKIIELGYTVVPYIIKKLKNEPVHLFIALNKITGKNPIKKESQGDINLMAKDWIDWWEQKNNVMD